MLALESEISSPDEERKGVLVAHIGAALLGSVLWLDLAATDWLLLSGSLVVRPQSPSLTPRQQAGS